MTKQYFYLNYFTIILVIILCWSIVYVIGSIIVASPAPSVIWWYFSESVIVSCFMLASLLSIYAFLFTTALSAACVMYVWQFNINMWLSWEHLLAKIKLQCCGEKHRLIVVVNLVLVYIELLICFDFVLYLIYLVKLLRIWKFVY